MLKKLLLSAALLISAAGVALAAGAFQGFPGVGVTANTNCLSTGNNGVCNQFQPAGPTYLQGTETFPADSNYVNPQGAATQPYTITIPTSLFGLGYGNAFVSTTAGTTAAVQATDGTGAFIYAGTGVATYTSFKLPPNPMTNQKFCLTNAGTGVLTLTAIAAGVNTFGNTPTLTGTSPTTIPVQVASGAAGTYVNGSNCWIYVAGASNTGIWYRVQ